MMDADQRQSWKPWSALVVAAALYIVFQVVPLLRHSHQNDFKHIWLGALLLAEGQAPYAPEVMQDAARTFAAEDTRFRTILPYVYLPFTGIVLRPLSWLSFHSASIFWQLVNHVLLVGGLLLAARAGGWKWRWQSIAIIATAVVFNYTVLRQNNAGQLNMVLVFGSALLAFGITRRWHPAALGFITAFLMLFKLTPGIFMIWFLLTKRWREAGWTLLIATGLMSISLPLAGLPAHLEFVSILGQMGFGKSTWASEGMTFWRDPYNQSLNSFFSHILEPAPGFEPWIAASSRVAQATTWVFALAILLVFVPVCVRSDCDGSDWRLSFSLAVLTSLLLPGILWDHYLVQAVVPALLVWNTGESSKKPLRITLIAAFLIWSAGAGLDQAFIHPGVLTAVGLRFEVPLPFRNGPVELVWMSLKLWPLLVLFGVVAFTALKSPWESNPARLDASRTTSSA